MADFFPELLFDRQDLFESPIIWAPGLISIAVALSVVVVLRTVRLQSQVVIATALIFEIVSSYGIAAAEFLQPLELTLRSPWIGLSWVAVWTYAFNVVVPTPPRYAVVAALAAVSSVPAMVALSLAVFPFAAAPDGLTIFFRFGFPYILVVILSYGGAHVVYSLGKEVKRARELGSYRLVVRLGEGGMGEVWKARHRLLARPAAIKHAHQPPEPPSARTELPIPPDLDELVLSCLAKDRDCRPTSPRDLLERLEIVMLRQQPWTEARAREWWTMHLPPSAE
jgi:serine/threonine-protein kinase